MFGDTDHHVRDLHRRRPVTKDKFPPSWRLEDLATWLELPIPEQSHRAGADAKLTWEVLYHTMDRYGSDELLPRQQLVQRFFDEQGKPHDGLTPSATRPCGTTTGRTAATATSRGGADRSSRTWAGARTFVSCCRRSHSVWRRTSATTTPSRAKCCRCGVPPSTSSSSAAGSASGRPSPRRSPSWCSTSRAVNINQHRVLLRLGSSLLPAEAGGFQRRRAVLRAEHDVLRRGLQHRVLWRVRGVRHVHRQRPVPYEAITLPLPSLLSHT